ncbi:MAG: PorV/PorQ family protein [Balneolaceae bacterium]|nr:PorV/PorQ family protein [Balneolaceae bacterium]MBO6545182.1 PorV/PorQ family protein [Balneolaceae bacterium]MBO6646578.1 PorV/PorQ family protein [Balneolaceae bacterium]
MKFYIIPLLIVVSCFAKSDALAQSFGEDRAGTESFQFTKIAVDPRSAAMGNSNMADAVDGSSLYWNPALSARLQSSNLMISHTSYFAGINQDYFSYVHKLGTFAISGSVQYLSSGDIIETTEFQPFGTGRTFSTQHMAAGLSGAHQVTELFSYGITLKFLMEKIEEVNYNTGAIDFGFHYLVGDTGLRFAVGINNFGLDGNPNGTTTRENLDGIQEIEPDEYSSLPTRFHIGAAYDLIDNEQSRLVLTGQITNPSDNAEQFNIGAEYAFMGQFFVRSGYEFGVEERKIPSLGGGVQLNVMNRVFKADYAYTLFERLGAIHRIAISFSL